MEVQSKVKAKTIAVPALETPSRAAGSASAHRLPALFVWGIWAALVLGGLAFTVSYHTAIPFGEDWDHMIPWIAGEIPVTLQTLWEPLEMYRNFLLKLALRVLLWLSGGYYWSVTAFYLVCLGGLSFAMIRASTRLRGRTSYADAFFPLVLLHWAFCYHVYFGELICLLLSTVIAGAVLVVIVRKGTELTWGTGLLAGTCLVLLPLCSIYGMVYVPALLVWFVYAGVRAWRSGAPQGRTTGAVVLVLAVATLGLFGFYFVGIDLRRAGGYNDASWWEKLRASWGLLTLSWGEAAVTYWPLSGLVTALLLFLSVGALAVGIWRRQPANRPFGLLCFLGAVLTMALAYGRGRASPADENPVSFYYGSLPVLVLCGLFFVWGNWHHRDAGHFIQMCLFTVMAMAFSLDMQDEFVNQELYWNSRRFYNEQKVFEQEIQEGVPPFQILARHHNSVVGLSNSDAARLNQMMHKLHRAGFGLFRFLKVDPAMREMPLPLNVIERHGVTWENGTGRITEPEGYLTFSLPQPTYVAGLRIQIADEVEPKVAWKSNGADYPATPQYDRHVIYQEQPGFTVYIAETIDQFRLSFPEERNFRIVEILLLTPEGEAPAVP